MEEDFRKKEPTKVRLELLETQADGLQRRCDKTRRAILALKAADASTIALALCKVLERRDPGLAEEVATEIERNAALSDDNKDVRDRAPKTAERVRKLIC
jgi:hypothetical protein